MASNRLEERFCLQRGAYLPVDMDLALFLAPHLVRYAGRYGEDLARKKCSLLAVDPSIQFAGEYLETLFLVLDSTSSRSPPLPLVVLRKTSRCPVTGFSSTSPALATVVLCKEVAPMVAHIQKLR
jgi:hypothetical protein